MTALLAVARGVWLGAFNDFRLAKCRNPIGVIAEFGEDLVGVFSSEWRDRLLLGGGSRKLRGRGAVAHAPSRVHAPAQSPDRCARSEGS